MHLEIGVSEVKLRSTCSTPKSIKHYDGCTTPVVVHRSNPHHFPTILVSSVHLNRQRNRYNAYKKLLPLNYVITCSFALQLVLRASFCRIRKKFSFPFFFFSKTKKNFKRKAHILQERIF